MFDRINENQSFEAKNFKQFVSSFSHEQALNRNMETNRPAIILPKSFFENIKSICNNTDKENQGVFLVKKHSDNSQDIFIVESMLNLGSGSEGSVKPDENKVNAILKLLQQYPEMRTIDYHTHPKSLGNYYSENFSDFSEGQGGDALALTNAINKNKEYMHVLLTSTHFITYGLKLPQFIMIDSNDKAVDAKQIDKDIEWQKKFGDILIDSKKNN